jgi:hypothetical protein
MSSILISYFCSAAFIISAGLLPQQCETKTFVSNTILGSCFFDEDVYIFLGKTHFLSFIPNWLEGFFEGCVNYFFENYCVVDGYGENFLAFL